MKDKHFSILNSPLPTSFASWRLCVFALKPYPQLASPGILSPHLRSSVLKNGETSRLQRRLDIFIHIFLQHAQRHRPAAEDDFVEFSYVERLAELLFGPRSQLADF